VTNLALRNIENFESYDAHSAFDFLSHNNIRMIRELVNSNNVHFYGPLSVYLRNIEQEEGRGDLNVP
jgi:hypothetical protein